MRGIKKNEVCLVPGELMSSAGDGAVDNWLQFSGIKILMLLVYKGLSSKEGGTKSTRRNH